MNTIEIRPLFRESVQGRNVSNIIDGKKVGTTKAPGGKFIFQIGDSARTRRLAIDLSYEVPNPWYDNQANLPSNWRNTGIEKQERVTKQIQLEIKYNKPNGFLNNESFDPFDVDSRELRKKERTYLQSIMHVFEDGRNVLNLDRLHDEIIYEAIKSSRFFALDYDDAIRRSNSVRFYVSHLEQEAEERANRNRIKLETLGNLRDLITQFPGQIYNVALVLGLVNGKVSQELIENKLTDFIESTNDSIYNGRTRDRRSQEFNEIFKLATSKKKEEKARFATMVLAQELINNRVIYEQVGQFIWPAKRGSSLEKFANSKDKLYMFLEDPTNIEYVDEMKEEMKTKI